MAVSAATTTHRVLPRLVRRQVTRPANSPTIEGQLHRHVRLAVEGIHAGHEVDLGHIAELSHRTCSFSPGRTARGLANSMIIVMVIRMAAGSGNGVGPGALLLGWVQRRRPRGDTESPGQLAQRHRGTPTGQQLTDQHAR